MQIIFFGSDSFGIPTLRVLKDSTHQILLVVTAPDRPAGRGLKMTVCPMAMEARELELELFQPLDLRSQEVKERFQKMRPEIFVVAAYGKFLPDEILGIAKRGAVNLHPSLLPKHRGAAPVPWALIKGEKETGVTTMTIIKEMDAGDLYLQERTEIGAEEDATQLEGRLSHLGAKIVLKTLEGLERRYLKAVPQDASQVSFAPKLNKEDGHLKFSEKAYQLYNRIRALKPWPGAYCYWEGKQLKIWKATWDEAGTSDEPGTVQVVGEAISVTCGQGSLRLLEVQLEGKKRTAAVEFLRGHPISVGTKLT